MSSKNQLLLAVGKRIRRLREKGGWTQIEFAVHLGMNRGHLSDIELGKREPGLLILQSIAQGLETTMARLLKGL